VTGASIRVDRASFARGRTPVLHDVSLAIEPGELVLLLGASGAGKSTMLSALAGVLSPVAGSVDVRSPEVPVRAGFVPQLLDEPLSPLAVEEVVALGRLRRGWSTSAEERVEARTLLDSLGLQGRYRARLDELSGGQRQRVLVARALMSSRALLLCDEPTSGVDTLRAAEVARVLSGLAAAGCTVIVATHDVAAFAPHADRFLALRAGRLYADTTRMDDDLLATVYGEG